MRCLACLGESALPGEVVGVRCDALYSEEEKDRLVRLVAAFSAPSVPCVAFGGGSRQHSPLSLISCDPVSMEDVA